MLSVDSILCPVDFSEQSRRALMWAATIAKHRGGELLVLFVGEPLLTQAASIRLGLDLGRTETCPALRRLIEATLSPEVRLGVPLQPLLAVGDPTEVILRTARRRKVGLIVMGTHGRGGFRKFLLGSTTEEVLRLARCAVLAVPAGNTDPLDSAGRIDLRGILLATDFRDGAAAAAHWAADLAFDLHVPLVVGHVVEPLLVPRRWQGLAADAESDRVAAARARLTRLTGNLRETRVSTALSVGARDESIAEMAVEHGAGLVVMGRSTGETDPSSGAAAYRVLRRARVPLLVVPARTRTTRPDAVRPSPGSSDTHDDSHIAHPKRRRAKTAGRDAVVRQRDGALGATAR